MSKSKLSNTEQQNTVSHARDNTLKLRTAAATHESVTAMLQLQNTLGNRAVGQVLQPKLKVNQPGDKYEQEADRIADLVMRMPDNAVQDISHSPATVQRKCAACSSGGKKCAKCAEEEEKIQRKPLAAQITPLVQRRENSAAVPTVTPQVASQINSLRGGGQPLPETTRRFFEPRFGADFSGVRIHKNSQANKTANEINARAYTIGQDIVFGSSQYSTATITGKKLLAHELTHVVQQRRSQLRVQREVDGATISKPPREEARDNIKELVEAIETLQQDLTMQHSKNLVPFLALIALDKSSVKFSHSFLSKVLTHGVASLFGHGVDWFVEYASEKGRVGIAIRAILSGATKTVTRVLGFVAATLVEVGILEILHLFTSSESPYSIKKQGAREAVINTATVYETLIKESKKKREDLLETPNTLQDELDKLLDYQTGAMMDVANVAKSTCSEIKKKTVPADDMSLYQSMLTEWILSNAGSPDDPSKFVDKDVWRDALKVAHAPWNFEKSLREKHGYTGLSIPRLPQGVPTHRNLALFISQTRNLWSRVLGLKKNDIAEAVDKMEEELKEVVALSPDFEDAKRQLEHLSFQFFGADAPRRFLDVVKAEDNDQRYNDLIEKEIEKNRFDMTCTFDLYDDHGSIYVNKWYFDLSFNIAEQEWHTKQQDYKRIEEAEEEIDLRVRFNELSAEDAWRESQALQAELDAWIDLQQLPWYKTKFWIQPD